MSELYVCPDHQIEWDIADKEFCCKNCRLVFTKYNLAEYAAALRDKNAALESELAQLRSSRDETRQQLELQHDDLVRALRREEELREKLAAAEQREKELRDYDNEEVATAKLLVTGLEQQLASAREALRWIATVNETLDLRKLTPAIVISMVYELRGKAKAALVLAAESNKELRLMCANCGHRIGAHTAGPMEDCCTVDGCNCGYAAPTHPEQES